MGKGKKKKVGKRRHSAAAKNIGNRELANPKSDAREHPLFGLSQIDRKYCISDCTKDEKSALIDTMHKLARLTWGQIRNAGRHQSGFELIEASQVKCKLPDKVTKDTKLYVFRFFGKAPIIGYKKDTVFHLLVVDRNFTAYNHG